MNSNFSPDNKKNIALLPCVDSNVGDITLQTQSIVPQILDETTINLVILEERETVVHRLAFDIQQVSELFTDLYLLVQEEGENIDNIETNIINSNTNVKKATKELHKASKYQKSKRKCICILYIFLTSILFIIILCLNLTNKLK